eukprot:gnl/MRDRNA2_/MRDRNA2_91523_c0_seq1.p1 gnl/MRDRNA2_/MRDRNA2_91523_c0~~gnl/MRDRNA2_/MRDRNA2_91523_c0_seq1.p1  ORF type:complete len:212 (+),score=75.83 gnl/MRDRNA2_/MRDRNA2_91523_c0_seq1:120-755(+)
MAHFIEEGRNSGRIKQAKYEDLDFEQFMEADVAKFLGMKTDEEEFIGDAGRSSKEYRENIKKRESFAEAQYEMEIDKLHKRALPPARVAPVALTAKEKIRKVFGNINLQFTNEDEDGNEDPDEPVAKKQKTEPDPLDDLMGDFDLMGEAHEAGEEGTGTGSSAPAFSEPSKVEPKKDEPSLGTIAGYASDESDDDPSDDDEPKSNLLNPLA